MHSFIYDFQVLKGGQLTRQVLVSLLCLQGEPLARSQAEELLTALPRVPESDGAVDLEKYASMLTAPLI